MTVENEEVEIEVYGNEQIENTILKQSNDDQDKTVRLLE